MYTCWLRIACGFSSTVVLLLLAACGGGGGGGGGGFSAVQYSGNTSAAVVTTGNSSQLVVNVFGGDASTINSSLTGVSTGTTGTQQNGTGGLTALTQRLNASFRAPVVQASRPGSAQRSVHEGATVNETEPCDSGSVHTTGTLNDTNGTGTLTITFNDCRSGDDTLAGQATVRVDAFDVVSSLPTDFTVSFGRLTIRGPAVSIDAGGSAHLELNIGPNMERITDNLVSLDNLTSKMTKAENLVFVNNIFLPSSYNTTLSGRVFDSVLGFVDITTNTAASFSGLTQFFPDNGQVVLTGSGNGKVQTTALSATLAKLELDLDGNGTFDNTATLKWTDLSGPVGSDLGDDDHDSMHNSWETANGLSPTDSADAILNNDGDAANNLAEYLAGTDPNQQ